MRSPAVPIPSITDVEAAREGDLRAFRRLYESHAGLVLRLVRARLPSHPRPDLVAEEIWLGLRENLRELDDPLRWLPWMIQSAQAWVERHYADELLESDTEEFPQLELLEPSTREVVRQRYLLGRTFDRIAEACGLSRTDVSLALRRAKAKLQWHASRSVPDHD